MQFFIHHSIYRLDRNTRISDNTDEQCFNTQAEFSLTPVLFVLRQWWHTQFIYLQIGTIGQNFNPVTKIRISIGDIGW